MSVARSEAVARSERAQTPEPERETASDARRTRWLAHACLRAALKRAGAARRHEARVTSSAETRAGRGSAAAWRWSPRRAASSRGRAAAAASHTARAAAAGVALGPGHTVSARAEGPAEWRAGRERRGCAAAAASHLACTAAAGMALGLGHAVGARARGPADWRAGRGRRGCGACAAPHSAPLAVAARRGRVPRSARVAR